MRRYPRVNKGFTFLEVLLASIILSVALLPIMTWVPVSIQTKLKAERKTTAIFLCQSKIEELRYKIIKDFNYAADNGGFFISPYENFSYTVTYSVENNLKKISLKVWHIENPQDETTFYTQIARR